MFVAFACCSSRYLISIQYIACDKNAHSPSSHLSLANDHLSRSCPDQLVKKKNDELSLSHGAAQHYKNIRTTHDLY